MKTKIRPLLILLGCVLFVVLAMIISINIWGVTDRETRENVKDISLKEVLIKQVELPGYTTYDPEATYQTARYELPNEFHWIMVISVMLGLVIDIWIVANLMWIGGNLISLGLLWYALREMILPMEDWFILGCFISLFALLIILIPFFSKSKERS